MAGRSTEPVQPPKARAEVLAEMEAFKPELIPNHDGAELAAEAKGRPERRPIKLLNKTTQSPYPQIVTGARHDRL